MKKLILAFSILLSVVSPVLADSTAVNQLMGLGMSPELAGQIDSLYATGMAQSLIPGTTASYDLGASAKKWRDAYLSRNVTVGGTLGVTGAVTATAGVLYPAALIETVAAGTSSQGDGPLSTGKYFHLVTGFDETKVATLPACAAANIGEVHFIMNPVTNKFAKIFPASGAQINSLGANAAYTQGVTGQGGKVLVCACQAATQWYCG